MTRHSLRIKEKQAPSADSDMQDVTASSSNNHNADRKHARDDEYHEELEDEELEEERSRKRARKSGSRGKDQSAEFSPKKTKQRMPAQFRKVRGRLGMLERLAKDVPLDVIFEIFCYLEPGDLIRLARTSRDLRGILMSKSSESIWRTARENVEGLPPLPLDLNEPQYAHLLYEAYCHLCNHKGRCETVLWSFRMRCCKNCAIEFPDSYDWQYRKDLPAELKLSDVLPEERILGATRRHRRDVGNFQIAARLKAEYEALQTAEERSAWITRKEEERRAVVAHGRQCETWHQARLNKRTGELSDIRRKGKKREILERLAEIGWREEAEKIIAKGSPWRKDEFTNHKAVKQSKKLTQYGWNNIKTELVEMLSNHKTERLADERRRTLSQRYARLEKGYNDVQSAMDLREPFPALGDILSYKVFEDLIWDTPEDNELTEVFFQEKLAEHLPHLIEEWRPAKVQELVEIMKKSVPNASAAELHLATSVFECRLCTSRPKMHYPQMFYHSCFTHRPPAVSVGAQRLATYSSCGPWSSRFIFWSNSGSQILQKIVEGCSLDPATATIQDLYSANPLIECTTCYLDPTRHYYQGGRAFMRWPVALGHSSHALSFNSFGEETQQILASEPGPSIYTSVQHACCAHCHNPVTRSFQSLVDHFKANHKDSIDVEKLEASSTRKLEDIQEHWYWSPRISLGLLGGTLGGEFRYTPPPVPPVDVAVTSTGGVSASTSGTTTTPTTTASTSSDVSASASTGTTTTTASTSSDVDVSASSTSTATGTTTASTSTDTSAGTASES
ncbi:hypothetical protein BT96DRAFT_996887 [Gymnopus androsaceus JB14]|uniref:F-box domain-containing protein n=1 Tax=Gymnopus androsaceus JB14 TaxID=1447944 RepID=A0A6A4HEG0_9AGAR|nr:hypothetical protein BT96DRAFT_996887 [Gymnopus androsaceus JB14]